MKSTTSKVLTIAGIAGVLTASGVGYAMAQTPGDDGTQPTSPPSTAVDDADTPAEQQAASGVTQADVDRAIEIALAETGGGSIVEAEFDGEDGQYEVEIRVADGSEVDVELDAAFAVVAATPEGPDDDSDDANEVDDDADDANEVDDD